MWGRNKLWDVSSMIGELPKIIRRCFLHLLSLYSLFNKQNKQASEPSCDTHIFFKHWIFESRQLSGKSDNIQPVWKNNMFRIELEPVWISCHQFPFGPVFHCHFTSLRCYICHTDNIYQASPACKYSKLQQRQRSVRDLKQKHRQLLNEMSIIGPFILLCFTESFAVERSAVKNCDVYCVQSPAWSLLKKKWLNLATTQKNPEYVSLTSW